jgi:hypothetical protein
MKTIFWLAALGKVQGSLVFGAVLLSSLLTMASAQDASPAASRTRRGLQALYDFSSTSGDIVKDRSDVGEAVDLRIVDGKAVRRSAGLLVLRGSTVIRSDKPAAKIINSVRKTGEITIEAWIRPARTDLTGPARIVTLSQHSTERNFTLGQEGTQFEARLRTTKTSNNGIPALRSVRNSLAVKITHVIYTRDRAGRTRVYVDGRQSAEGKTAGNTSNWNGSFRLALADELSGGRPWQGTYHLVAIYNRSLSPQEVTQNFKAGARATTPLVAQNQPSPNERLFETRVASILARRCLECHDSATRKGKLNLSRKAAALAGGENGKAIVPGKSAESLLWEQIESDDMPKDADPLSASEKKVLRQWIDSGAAWTIDVIDPVLYAHQRPASGIWVQRLTLAEYIETVRSAVGVDIAADARKILPPDLRADGFSNTAYNLNVDLKHVQAYAKLSEIIVGRMDVEAFAAKFSKSRKLSTDATMRQFVASMGKWLLRGPLEVREISSYSGIATTVASAGGNFREAVGFIIEAMLQSPRFIYRVERQRGDGTNWPVGDYELASRMSYIIWGGPPDRELMRAADDGKLADKSLARKQVQRMLKDPRAIERSVQFIDEWLNLGRLANLSPNAKRFPKWDNKLAGDMRAETLAFFKEIAWTQKRPLADLFNAQVTFATPRLAKHYGLKPKGDGLNRYDVSAVPGRGGLLTQGSMLTIGGDDASMVTRGLFVLHDVLRGTVKDPPAGLDTTPVPSKPGLSQRHIAEARIVNKSCGGCHSKFEPLAFGLEMFDGVGARHEKDEHGNKLREDGLILLPGGDKPVSYKSSAELMDLLAGSERVRQTITWKVTQFALGRPLAASDARVIAKLHAATQKAGGTYEALINEIVMSDLVRMTRTERENVDGRK